MNLLDLFIRIGAKDEASKEIEGISSKVKSGLGGAVRAAGVAVATATTAAVAGVAALTKSAYDGYASYEQLAGGVEKLYQGAADRVKKYADEAYKTSGMSANQYMEQATSFSAALINSLNGDVQRAADQTDKAMRLMSDNVNTFGTDAQAVQNAIQGLSRENYTMIDNLKLGYAGTKEGMQQLIDDANEYARQQGINANLTMGNFSDMIDAIDLIQQKQHIAGTTAKEAATTIEGATGMMRAAWSNFVTELGKPEGDVGAKFESFVDAAKTALLGFENEQGEMEGGIIRLVGRTIQAIAEQIPQAVPVITDAINQVLPLILDVIGQTAPSLLEGVMQVVQLLCAELPNLLVQMLPVIIGITPQLVLAGIQLFLGLVQALTEAGPEIFDAVSAAITSIFEILGEYGPDMLEAAGALFMMIATALLEHAPEILAAMLELVLGLIAYVVEHIPDMLKAAADLVGKIFQAITDTRSKAAQAWANFIGDLVDKAKQLPSKIANAFKNLGTLLLNAGRNIIAGLWNGMVEKAKSMFSWVSGLAGRIASLKGPLDYDKTVLVANGKALIGGLAGSMRNAFENDVVPYVSSIAGRIRDEIGTISTDVEYGVKGGYDQSGMPQGVLDRMGSSRQGRERDITIVLELDRMQFARAVYRMNDEETQRVGVRLAGSYA